MSTATGNQAELRACNYLQAQGLTLITRNYRTRRGELDILMQDGGVLVCVEVKYRRSNTYGNAAEFVNKTKLMRIRAALEHYLVDNGLHPDTTAMRIDVIAMDGDAINWIQNAG